jgi:hypothetical protein
VDGYTPNLRPYISGTEDRRAVGVANVVFDDRHDLLIVRL